MTEAQKLILADRARKHKALLHNQAVGEEATEDTRVNESELILWNLLTRFGLLSPEEQIEEIAAIDPDVAFEHTGVCAGYLSIQTDRQTLQVEYQ